jgi:predicted site-specific integrase-resolvase
MKIYSTKQVGNIFGVTAQTVKSWIKKNQINCLRTTNQEYILTDENIEELKWIIAKRYKLDFQEGTSNDNKEQ